MYPCPPRSGSTEAEITTSMRVYEGTEDGFLGFLAESSELDADETVGVTLTSERRLVPPPRTILTGGTELRQDSFYFDSTWPETNTSNNVRSAELSATSSLTGALGPSMFKDARRISDVPREATLPSILRKSQQVTESSKKCRSSASKTAKVRFVGGISSATSQEASRAPRNLHYEERSQAHQVLASKSSAYPYTFSGPSAVSTSRKVSSRVLWYKRTETPQFSYQQLRHRKISGPFVWESCGHDWLTCTHCNEFAGKRPRDVERHTFFCAQNPNRISFSEWGTARMKDVRRVVAAGAAGKLMLL